MRKLPEVEAARALMAEAMAWSVMKWLREKKRVRKVADQANAALDELNRTVKANWRHEVRDTYLAVTQSNTTRASQAVNQDLIQFIHRVQDADDQASRARMDAERTFDEAERLLSTSLAREGCQKAIRSWDLHEKAIRRAETDLPA